MNFPEESQPRQRKLYGLRAQALGFLITCAIVCLAYLLLRIPITNMQYQQVLESNGMYTLEEIQSVWMEKYALGAGGAFFVLWIVMMLLAGFLASRQRSASESDDFEATGSLIKGRKAGGFSKARPNVFEQQVARLITQQTGYSTQVVNDAGDSGVNIRVYDSTWQLVGIVQCKGDGQGKALTTSFVREMETIRHIHRVNIAYLATTTYFTQDARRLAKQLDVRLIDGDDLRHALRNASAAVN